MSIRISSLPLPLPTHQLRIFAAALFGAAVALLIMHAGLVKTLPERLLLTPQPARLTELSFVAPQLLPSTYGAGTPATVAFEVQNHEQRTMTYPYRVYMENRAGSKLIAEGMVRVLPDKSTIVEQTHIIPAGSGRTRLLVTLPDERQNIHLWLEHAL